MILVLVALLALLAAFVWFRMSMKTWLITAIAVFTLGLFSGVAGMLLSLLLLAVLVPLKENLPVRHSRWQGREKIAVCVGHGNVVYCNPQSTRRETHDDYASIRYT